MHVRVQHRFAPFFCLIFVAACGNQKSDDKSKEFDYPPTRTVDQVDIYHGIEVEDPYRWLEADIRNSEDVANWVEAQNALTFHYLDRIPERGRIEKRLTELWDYERYSMPVKYGDRYFYYHNDGLQNQSVLYMLASLDAEPEILIDPNAWSDDGTIALAAMYPSPDGSLVAYLVQDSGSDWRTASVLNIATGESLPDRLEWLKFTGLSWAGDGSGFYYSRYPATSDEEKFQALNRNMKVYFHRVGTPQEDDVLAFETPGQPDWGPRATVTDDGRHLVITIAIGTDDRYQIGYRDLTDPDAETFTLIPGFEHDYSLIGNVGAELYFRTNDGAPRNRIVAVNVRHPARPEWRNVVDEGAEVLSGVGLVGGRLIAEFMQDAWSVVRIFDLDGAQLGSVDLPGIGTAKGFYGYADDPETFFRYTSFTTPPRIYRYDAAKDAISLFREPAVAFDPADFVTEQVFFFSKDGTRVPMFITHRRDITRNGRRPTMLYGYGGFNSSQRPAFSVTRLAWMEMGGVYAVANLRGGGEYGEEWHQAGTRLNKQNVFDDFIAAAEYLIDAGYTSSEKLAIFGGSNGGLLVAAVVNQRPELFGAAIAAVPVADMLRFDRFTAGRFWTDDYGSSDDPEEFRALYAYSPLHNVRSGVKYPAVLVTTADTDDRVVPAHSFKYTAALQAAQAGPEPVLIRVETRAGHGSGKPTEKTIRDYADRWAFLVDNLDMQLPEGFGR